MKSIEMRIAVRRAWCNLEDTEYLLTPSTQSVLSEYLGEPRTYGVSVGLRF